MAVFRFSTAHVAGALLVVAGGLAWNPMAVAQTGDSQAGIVSAPAAAQLDSVNFDIPAQDLGPALVEFARQSGQQLFYAPETVVGKTGAAVSGTMSKDDAITALLQGTGLESMLTPEGGMMIGTHEAMQTYRERLRERSSQIAPADDSLVAAAAPDASAAASVEVKHGGIEEIIVTAQKKSENIQDVPIAITALSMEDLTNRQVSGGPDLFTQVPNMSFTKTNFTGYSIQIRGIGTQAISATTDPAVAVALNNTPFLHNRFFEQEFFDMDRVEILRGPQGTLYGRNATAGVVNLITAKPEFYEESRFSADIGNYNSRRYEGMYNIPLDDHLALRVAGEWTQRDGYSTNELTGSPIDGRDLWSSRTSLRYKPSDAVDVNLVWEHFKEGDDRLRSGKQLCDKDVVTNVAGQPVNYFDTLSKNGQSILFAGVQALFSQGCQRDSLYDKASYQTPNGLMLPYYLPLGALNLPTALLDPYASTQQSRDLRNIESTIDPRYRAESDIGELQASFDLGHGLTLSSETAYNADSVYSLEDYNRFNTAHGAWGPVHGSGSNDVARGVLSPDGVFCDPQLGCSDRLVVVDVSSGDSKQFSQELRLASNFDGPFNFSLGANFLRFDTEDKYYVFSNSFTLSALNSTGSNGPYTPNVTDNSGCLPNGHLPSDPNGVYSVGACQYVDPNTISKVNDQGHNYFLSDNPYSLKSYALFGETYYKINDQLTVTTGLRWSVDKKTAPRIPSQLLTGGFAGYGTAEVIRQQWSKPTGRLVIDWKPDLSFTDKTLLYASYSRGYKAGGANPPSFTRNYYADASLGEVLQSQSDLKPKTFKPEYVNAFELGSKNTLLDGRVQANASAFFYDYKGYQVSEIVDRAAYNHNYDAKVWGAELELDWLALENLNLGFKGGYEKTRIGNGETAIDLMDRTAGHDQVPDENGVLWQTVRPFPTQASNCILPTYVYEDPSVQRSGSVAGGIRGVGNPGGGGPGGCEIAYVLNQDPQTGLPYVPNPTVNRHDAGLDGIYANYPITPGYIGFDPATAPNHGEGFSKNLGGNELPNAPDFTATVTADYGVPLAGGWLGTLHTDFHWQSKSWWRVFDDSAYGRLRSYYTVNLAFIFTKPSSGWNVMAYVKNVTDQTAITGAFLNSDDTGLTTNLFLTDPRLYGIRVTKSFE